MNKSFATSFVKIVCHNRIFYFHFAIKSGWIKVLRKMVKKLQQKKYEKKNKEKIKARKQLKKKGNIVDHF